MCQKLALCTKWRKFFPPKYLFSNPGTLTKPRGQDFKFFSSFNKDFKFFSSFNNNPSIQAVDLSFTVFQPETQLSSPVPVIILHGVLGSKQNWRGIGNALAEKSKRKVYALDARNHGDSPHTDDLSFPLMSEDVKRFMHSQAIQESVIVGHSMGGRTAMCLALTDESLVNKLVVVDMGPTKVPQQSSFIPKYMKLMIEAIDFVPKQSLAQARRSIDEYLAKEVPEIGIRQFLITNLTEENNQLKWKPNIDLLCRKFNDALMQFPSGTRQFAKETLFICGANSSFVKPEDYPDIRKLFPKAEFIHIDGAGHWVHSEKPSEFLNALCGFL